MGQFANRAENFNDDISNWTVSNVQDFSSMFWEATAFNQDLNNWDISSAENMQCMFCGASSFSQTLCWNVSASAVLGNGVFDDSNACFDPNCVQQKIIERAGCLHSKNENNVLLGFEAESVLFFV